MTDVPRGTFAEITIPFPVSGNRLWRVWNKKIVKSKEAKVYINSVLLMTLQFRRMFWEGRLFMHVELYPPDGRARDLDNHCKVLLDSLQEAQVIQNDSQIDILLVERKEIRDLGCAIVKIMETKDSQCYLQNNYANS